MCAFRHDARWRLRIGQAEAIEEPFGWFARQAVDVLAGLDRLLAAAAEVQAAVYARTRIGPSPA